MSSVQHLMPAFNGSAADHFTAISPQHSQIQVVEDDGTSQAIQMWQLRAALRAVAWIPRCSKWPQESDVHLSIRNVPRPGRRPAAWPGRR